MSGDIYCAGGLVEQMIADNQVQDEDVPFGGEHPAEHAARDIAFHLDSKKRATLQARAAIAGYELVALADGSFIISRWGMFRTLDHMAAVEAFLSRIEGDAPRG